MSQLLLDPSEFPAGIAIWGGVEPIFMSDHRPNEEAGIHVHARKIKGAEKDIDQSFDEVIFHHPPSGRDTRIDQEAAVAFMISQVLGIPMRHVLCAQCGTDVFLGRDLAASPVRLHRCQVCSAVTSTEVAVVANPLIALRQNYSSRIDPAVFSPERDLKLSWDEMPGGIDIWGSNQAIIWTAERAEEEGLHVHWYAADGSMVRDDTFSSVKINEREIDVGAARLWMAQREVYSLRSVTISIVCDACSEPLCDRGEGAYIPSTSHTCPHCGNETISLDKVIANPTVQVIKELKRDWALHRRQNLGGQ